jgi:hypothetical protein
LDQLVDLILQGFTSSPQLVSAKVILEVCVDLPSQQAVQVMEKLYAVNKNDLNV